ncbi:MAG: hypothetical protein K940chlam7_00517 [Chlamydiae bacterium]|nr:hypothetical protein [Chlamydiota bacterium]
MLRFERFWGRHPALLYALAGLFGFSAAISWKVELLIPLVFLCIPSFFGCHQFRSRLIFAFVVLCAMFFYGKVCYQLPNVSPEGVQGSLHFQVSSVSASQTHFGFQWIYQGKAKIFISDETGPTGKNFPCTIRITNKGTLPRPTADRDYVIHGLLKKTRWGSYTFAATKKTPWQPVLGSWSLAEWRYSLRKGVKKYTSKMMNNTRSAEFLGGIITGDFEDRVMRMEFGKMGLQHLMAISGFHFALIAVMLSLLLRWIVPFKIATGILIFLLTSYFLFLGCGPSISRAWMMCLIALLSLFSEKPSYALNSLGVAILFILFYDPMLYRSLGFQFSMVTTASILLWYPIVKVWIENIFQKRHLGNMSRMSIIDQHCYCILAFIKEAVALAVAVNISALPMTLFFFQKFPYLSLLYNLFIPFLVSICMFLFLISSVVWMILPSIGSLIHAANAHFTHFMLNFVYNIPNTLNYSWRVSDFPLPYFFSYLCLVFLLGIALKCRYEEEHRLQKDLALI